MGLEDVSCKLKGKPKVHFLEKLLSSGKELPLKFVRESKDFLYRSGELELAAQYALRGGNHMEAISFYEEKAGFPDCSDFDSSGLLMSAESIALKFGLREKAEELAGRRFLLQDGVPVGVRVIEAKKEGYVGSVLDLYALWVKSEKFDDMAIEAGLEAIKYIEENLQEVQRFLGKRDEVYRVIFERYENLVSEGPGYWHHNALMGFMSAAKRVGDIQKAREISRRASNEIVSGGHENYMMVRKFHETSLKEEGFIDELADMYLALARRCIEVPEVCARKLEELGRVSDAKKVYSEAVSFHEDSGRFREALSLARDAGLDEKSSELEEILNLLGD